MLRSLYSGISGMKVNQTKLDVIGNNLANVSTTAFKGSRVNFSTTISQTLGSASAASDSLGGVNGKQIGLGAQISSIDKIMSQGSMQSTSRSLDVAVDGSGYFMVATGPALTGGNTDAITIKDNGVENMPANNSLAYTRDGSFVLDNEGNLLTSKGYRVLGFAMKTNDNNNNNGDNIRPDGTVLYVESNNQTEAIDDKLVSLKIPDKVTKIDKAGKETQVAVKSFNISSDGLITGVLETGEITALGQIAMSSFKNEVGLTDIGNNMYEPSGSSGAAIISSGKNSPTNRNSSGYGDILQGYLEMSGVDMAEQFTDMIVATKAFQAAGKTITTGDEILSEIINLKR
ncbi:flagellar hook-basal body complex protein [Clostridium sp. 29_15]|uniref:flagellar hook-basal body complex protein n=1 Tax=Clostridium sp. 29_15 TaxID=1896982 RepID=UPI0009647C4F|nr:flagellar hook-basal body complex protein [Clostridium sp. 29_15]OKZ85324.1 MAG: flagellar biosynthesis protein FlgE [Clostridium sp. 29_15]